MTDPNRALKRERTAFNEERRRAVRRFHRTLNALSGVMAAGIVLSGRDLSQLSSPLGLALVLFVVGLVAGVLLLRLLDWSNRLHRPGIWTLLLMVALRDSHRDEEAAPQVLVPMSSGPLTVLKIAARLAHAIFVAGGFALVIWSLGRDVLP